MKKNMKCVLAALMAALLFLPALAQAKRYYSIQEVKAQAAAGWQGSYQARGREIIVDVMPQVPDVDKVPVSVCRRQDLSPTIPQADPLWRGLRMDYPGDFMINYGLKEEEPAGALMLGGKKVSALPWKSTYWDFSPEEAYIPGNPTTFGEITSWLPGVLSVLGFDPGIIDLNNPEQIYTHAFYGPREGEYLAPGWGAMTWPLLIHGLPVIGDYNKAFIFKNPSFNAGARAEVSLCYQRPDLFWLQVSMVASVETLAEDIPLSGFSEVLESLEQEIAAGRLRQVFDMKLGYHLFEAPGFAPPGGGRDLARPFYAFPVWRVGCLYVEDARQKVDPVFVEDEDPYFYDPKNTLSYHDILVNAQTGELINPLKPSVKAVTYPGMISWAEAGN